MSTATNAASSTRMPSHPVARPEGRRVVARKRRLLVRVRPVPAMRTRVETAFRTLANGVEAPAAQGAAIAFYRSSGHDWAGCLS
jgi:hypothetical protein